MGRKERLIKRLRYLWTGELFASLFLPAVAALEARLLDQPLGLLSISSAALVAWLLWQGAVYWRLKLRAVRSDSTVARRHLRWFAALKTVNWALIGVLPVLLAAQYLAGAGFRSILDGVAGLGFYILAVLEQVNYYHYQLMYDYPPDWRYLVGQRKLKRSSLSRALLTLEEGEGV